MTDIKCIHCGNIIDCDGLEEAAKWCDMMCKKQFYLNHYSKEVVMKWELERDVELKESRKKVFAEIKKSGLTVVDYLHSLGQFKDAEFDEVHKETERCKK